MRSFHHRQRKLQLLTMRNLLLFHILLLFLPHSAESCLPSWFRQERSAPDPSEIPTTTSDADPSRSGLETNEIGDPSEPEFPTPPELTTPPPAATTTSTISASVAEDEKKLQEAVKELAEKEAEYEYEYEEEKAEEEAGEALKYNEKATKEASATLKPAVRKEIEKLKEAKCKDYCHHNATCHVEVIFRDDRISAVVPSCHCPHGWEGTRCDRHYVQAFYAPVSGRYNEKSGLKPNVYAVRPPGESTTSAPPPRRGFPDIFSGFYERIVQSSTSAVPAFGFLIVMLIMFIAIVVYAYRRMSKRADETTYTMSHMCPPDAFTVLKTPNGRHISVHQINSCAPPTTVTPASASSGAAARVPMRQMAVRNNNAETARNNFFSILRSQGTIPSRSINDDDTPKHYKSVPRVEVSAINYSGHIDFSAISFQSTSSEASKANATCPPPTHTVIEMDEHIETNFRSPSRSEREPGTPTTSEPMIPPNIF
ncbi:unnamed protein product [Caenorhabditis sp. 36 PRJEB53466]|nr:unnamed protein product [Caenorhabditis sp. 36 PRJEB53466]